jgi:hypothetical protein
MVELTEKIALAYPCVGLTFEWAYDVFCFETLDMSN